MTNMSVDVAGMGHGCADVKATRAFSRVKEVSLCWGSH
jgi:hypothetical protein